MSNVEKDLEHVTLLGNQNVKYKYDYDPTILERFEKHYEECCEGEQVVSLDCFEFVSRCVSGDTMIDIATNETDNPKGVPIRDLVGTEGYVFGVDPETLEPVCNKYSDVRMTRKDAPVVKIVMDELRGNRTSSTQHILSEVVCTPDHLILVRKGIRGSEWIQAKDLEPGMRIVSDQRSRDQMRGKSRHRLVGQAIFDEDIKHIHHIDGNHFNNSIDNLANISSSEHSHIHRSQDYGYDETLDVNILVDLYESGENFNSLSKMFNCDVSTIENRIGHLVNRRSQAESLQIKMDNINGDRDAEIAKLYEAGYLLSEIGDYFSLHPTRVSEIVKRAGIPIRESNYARYNRRKLDLPSLNHKVVKVIDAGKCDVYNMEVENVENFFGNGIVLHNCPKTGQPDLATIHINYIPNKYMVESKSLKLYLFSFQQHGDFHETCIHMILSDLVNLLDPAYCEVYGDFNSRGGISILPFSAYADEDHQEMKNIRQLSMMQYSMEHRPRTS